MGSSVQEAFIHLKNAISELGATGAPSATIMNFAGFLPYGVLMVAFGWGRPRWCCQPWLGSFPNSAELGYRERYGNASGFSCSSFG